MRSLFYISFFIFNIIVLNSIGADVDIPDNGVSSSITEIPQEPSDRLIQNRLKKIFNATEWFSKVELNVKEGLVILSGSFDSQNTKNWAMDVIHKTEGVVAVVDKTESIFSDNSILSPARNEAQEIYSKFYRHLPYLASAVVILLFFSFLSFLLGKASHSLLLKKYKNGLLVRAISNALGFLIFILGFYFALKASGLSALAVTLLGGTGMLGIGLGLALKSTFENYTSSIMISVRELLKMGEYVSIDGNEGIVQSVTTRGTTLMDFDGNNIVIPNTIVFNSVVKNFTRNPKMRLDFVVGIGYDDSIDQATSIIKRVLDELSPKVLKEPASIIAVDKLGASTVNLKVYFWLDSNESSFVKLKSLVLKKVKEELMSENISMPDDAREVVFASPLVIENSKDQSASLKGKSSETEKTKISETISLSNEELSSEIEDLKNEAKKAFVAEKGENLIS